jgi:tetratricopeptide (TPR) repeat protein
VARISADPDPFVPYVVPSLWTACAGRYNALGHYSNAVHACRQALRANAEDPQSQNLLAWIKATCPDASVRDGKQAVSAGTKACELTHWSEWNCLDTLAAAWAEAGDFDRAIRFEKLALRTGKPDQAEAKQMGERLSLYKQARPFREKH